MTIPTSNSYYSTYNRTVVISTLFLLFESLISDYVETGNDPTQVSMPFSFRWARIFCFFCRVIFCLEFLKFNKLLSQHLAHLLKKLLFAQIYTIFLLF